MSGNEQDRGMRAVARVREVRERDSRIGLLQAMSNVRMREEQLSELRTALGQAMTRSADTLCGFPDAVAARAAL